VGIATLVVKMTRRPEIPGISESGRNDQFAGFLLGGAKGAVLVAFLAAGILKYSAGQIETVSWAQDQVKASWVIRWSETFQPVQRVWSSRPVQHFVGHIRRMGVDTPANGSQSPTAKELEASPPVRTASRDTDAESSGADRSSGKARESSPSPPLAAPAEAPEPTPEAGETTTQSNRDDKAAAKGSN
jgi:hypothetical protein